MSQPLQVDLWPFDLESSVRVTCDVGYLCANFSLPRPLWSRLRPDVRDRRQTSPDRHSKLLLYNCKFHSIKEEQYCWTLSLHWSCLWWRCYHPYVSSAPNRQCPPINAFAAPLGLSYHGPRQNTKTWVQMTRRRQSS